MISSSQTVIPSFTLNHNHTHSSHTEAIRFLILNVLTVGLYGIYCTADLDQKYQNLQQRQICLMNKQATLGRSIEDIETLIRDLAKTLEKDTFYNQEHRFDQIQYRIGRIDPHLYNTDNASFCVIKRLFLNMLTLGLYGFREQYILKKQISQMTMENDFLLQKINAQAQQAKSDLNNDLLLLKKCHAAQKNIKIGKSADFINAKNTLPALQQKQDVALKALVSLQPQIQAKKQSVALLEETQKAITLTSHQITIHETTIAQKQQALTDLNNKLTAIQIHIQRVSFDKLRPLEREIKLLNDLTISPPRMTTTTSLIKTHPIYKGKTTAYQVIEASFEYAFDELIEWSQKGRLPIIFNTSADIFTNPKCKMNMKAVYRYMAYHIITHSSIRNAHTLQLNAEGLLLLSSCPEYVRTFKANHTSEDILTFKYNDSFTPPPGKELAKGIDPALAKHVYNYLPASEKEMLLWLLLEPLIPDENLSLQQYLEKFKEDNNSMRKLRAAYGLICDIGEGIEKKFGPFLGAMWLDKADDYTAQPLVKEVEEVIIEENNDGAIVDWEIDIDSFRKVDPDFAEMILESQTHYKRIWANMSKELLTQPYTSETDLIPLNGSNFKDTLRKQFHVWYQMLDGHYCLLSALCAITLTDASKFTGQNVTKIHKAMANHLDNPAIAERFSSLIASEHQITVQVYQQKLRQERISQFLGDTEITIFADLMGVRVIVFFPEDPHFSKLKLDEYGLQTPVANLNYFGPNTRERLYVTYQTSGQNYYYTFPKLQQGALTGEAEKSVQTVNTYWSTVEHNYY